MMTLWSAWVVRFVDIQQQTESCCAGVVGDKVVRGLHTNVSINIQCLYCYCYLLGVSGDRIFFYVLIVNRITQLSRCFQDVTLLT